MRGLKTGEEEVKVTESWEKVQGHLVAGGDMAVPEIFHRT